MMIIKENKILRTPSAIDSIRTMKEKDIKMFFDYLNKKMFRASKTPLSYRQINNLDNKKILKEERENKKKWRKFSFKDLVFLEIIKELRVYGISDKQLESLKNIFYKINKGVNAEFAILMVTSKDMITLVFDEEGIAYFYDFTGMIGHKVERKKSAIHINLNELVKDLWERFGKNIIEYKGYFEIFSEFMNKKRLNEKQNKIIEILDNENYKSISVDKKEKDEFIVKGKRTDKFSEKELFNIIKNKEFADIRILKRDGNIVHIEFKDIFKV